MLTAEDNELLTHFGPGTLMGNLFRRYWTPALLSTELPEPDDPPVRVRLLGENLVAFRDTNGRVGLVEEHCPHRGASVYFGRNEECGLRCVYHGWKFDVDGNCVDMPNEPAESNFKNKVKIRAYPTYESGGMVWTYMGPTETVTPFRDFGTETLAPEHIHPTKQPIYCNFVQSLDGDLDSAHISHLHQWFGIEDIPDDGTDKPGYPSNFMSTKIWRHDRAPRIEVRDEWYGYRYAAHRRTPNGYDLVRISAYAMPYTAMIASVPFKSSCLTIVPADDENTWRFTYLTKPPTDTELWTGGTNFQQHETYPYEERRRSGGMSPHDRPGRNAGVMERVHTPANDYLIDREAQKKVSFTGIPSFRAHDLMVTESMGPVYDRTREHLGTTDRAVIRMHEILLNAAKGLAQGKEPPALTGDFRGIRAAEKILESEEDWGYLGTDDDPLVQKYELAVRER
jgi:phenylpropionate dioxygenase-like ring-hydroxylating dioxygenase large terminal subunit